MSVLLLRLEGPLQAWSAQGKLGVRDTEREPTKSGVIGMVGAAMGMARDDDERLATLTALRMAVRVDRAGILLHDYHTAGGGIFRGESYQVFGTGKGDAGPILGCSRAPWKSTGAFAEVGLGSRTSAVALASRLGIRELATRDVLHFANGRLRDGRAFGLIVQPSDPHNS